MAVSLGNPGLLLLLSYLLLINLKYIDEIKNHKKAIWKYNMKISIDLIATVISKDSLTI